MNRVLLLLFACITLSSCASILRGNTPSKPNPCDPKRSISWGWLVADLILTGPVGVAIDFGTGGIYNPPKPGAGKKQPCKD